MHRQIKARKIQRKENPKRKKKCRMHIAVFCLTAAVLLILAGLLTSQLFALEQKSALVHKADGGTIQGQPQQNGPESSSEKKGLSSKSKKIDANNRNLVLVNPWNKLPEKYAVNLTHLKNGHAVDQRCYPSLQQMMDDCRAAGRQPLICSSYRSQEKQQQLFNREVDSLISQGYSEKGARKKAGTAIAVPGTSEHQTGLAVDIVDVHNQLLNKSQEGTPAQKWLIKNSWKYGFILRYPVDKSRITGIIYEPWHYRYVGKEVAKEIYRQDICLEEYLQ